MKRLGILLTSARPNRVGAHVSRWVLDALPDGVEVDLIDLGEVALPAFDEPDAPRKGSPRTTPHAEAWAQRIGALDALVILTPQYNGSYPGALKNAVDFLFAEWNDLPTLLVGYGWGGASEVLPPLEALMRRMGADVVDTIGLGFREDLSVEGELFVQPAKVDQLQRAVSTFAAEIPVHVG